MWRQWWICKAVCTCKIPSWNHTAHRKQKQNFPKLRWNVQYDSGGSPRQFAHFQSTLRMSVLEVPCIIYVRGNCYPPLPAEEGRKGDYKTTTWVTAGGRTGIWDFLDRLAPFTSLLVGIISSVLGLLFPCKNTFEYNFLWNFLSWGQSCCALPAINDLLSAVKCSLLLCKSWTDVKVTICDYWFNLSGFLKLATCKTWGPCLGKISPLWLLNFFVLGW